MNTALLNLFADRLDYLHATQGSADCSFHFDIDVFLHVMEADRLPGDHRCGTHGCAMGWLVTDPVLREAFEVIDRSDDDDRPFAALVWNVSAKIGVQDDPLVDNSGLAFEIFEDIFLPADEYSRWYEVGCDPTAAQVADAIRRYAAGERPPVVRKEWDEPVEDEDDV